MSEQPSVVLERHGNIARVTLNRPEAHNALNSELIRGLRDVCLELAADDEAWVVLLRGAGERAFSVGADLKERRGMDLVAIGHKRVTVYLADGRTTVVGIPILVEKPKAAAPVSNTKAAINNHADHAAQKR